MCHSGVGLTPIVDDRVHHFSAGGMYNGMALLIDDETLTYWDHITGEAVHGPLVGTRLPAFPLLMTTVGQLQLDRPRARAVPYRLSLENRLASHVAGWLLRRKKALKPAFWKTMHEVDPRLDPMTPGLAVEVDGAHRFYPLASVPVDDVVAGRPLRLQLGQVDRLPRAAFADGGEPMQFLTRWYGFAATYPSGEIGPTE